MNNRVLLVSLGLGLAMSSATTNAARGSAEYAQGFDDNGVQTAEGPANLVAEGWIFRNQSDNALSDAGWFDGEDYNQAPQSGPSCLYTASINTIPFYTYCSALRNSQLVLLCFFSLNIL